MTVSPTALSGMELKSGESGEAVTCTVTFRFTYYDIESTSLKTPFRDIIIV